MTHLRRWRIWTHKEIHWKMGIKLNITSWYKHVSEIQRDFRTNKERVWDIVNTLPFEQYPNRLIVEVVYNTVFGLNCFAHKSGLHMKLSPHTIITRSSIDYNKHCKLQFGTYVQVHKLHDNSLMPRTAGAFTLRPSINAQGSFYFLSLHLDKRIIRNRWTLLTPPAEVIATVHQLPRACKKYNDIVFTDKVEMC